jgi:hypothetical protein
MGIVDPDPVGSETFFEPVGSLSGMVHSGINFKETNTDSELIIPDRKKNATPLNLDVFHSNSHADLSKRAVFWTSRRMSCSWLS